MNSIISIEEFNIVIYLIKILFIIIFTYYTALNCINNNLKSKREVLIVAISIIIIAVICTIVKNISNSLNSIIALVVLLTILFAVIMKKDIGYSALIVLLSLSINYIMFFIASALVFIPSAILKFQSDYINLFFILIIYSLLLYLYFKKKRFKKGFSFLKRNLQNEDFDMLFLNISIIVLFTVIILSNYDEKFTSSYIFGFIVFSIIMFITIKKSLNLYYKQKLLIQDLTETKKELQSKNQRIQELEKENLKISKTNHFINHKQESLEHKVDELMLKTEISSELTIKDQINQISNQLTTKIATPELPKTNIEQIDDMLKYMQSECTKNKIDFNLQIKGNIYQMTNNYIPKEDLEILLADHIRNAIIAINHSNNVNRSILVRLGKLDGTYSLYIYDSGIEFEVTTLTTLGITPSTTHKDKGGTGMGFMNTFDTLNKTKSSIIINEYNKPTKENYTKSIMIKCDNKNEYKIFPYRAKEIEKSDQNNRLILIDTSKKEN